MVRESPQYTPSSPAYFLAVRYPASSSVLCTASQPSGKVSCDTGPSFTRPVARCTGMDITRPACRPPALRSRRRPCAAVHKFAILATNNHESSGEALFFRQQIRGKVVQIFPVTRQARFQLEVGGALQVPQLFRLGLRRHPVHGIRFPGDMHELHVIQGQRAFQGVHDVHDRRRGGQHPAGIGRSRRVRSFGEVQEQAEAGEFHNTVHGDGSDTLEVVPPVRRKLVSSFIAAPALDDLNHQFRPGQRAAFGGSHGQQRACRVAHAGHRPHGATYGHAVFRAFFQRGVRVERQGCARSVLPVTQHNLRGQRLFAAPGGSAVERHLHIGRADASGAGDFDSHIGIPGGYAGHARRDFAARDCGRADVAARLTPDGHGHQNGFLSAGRQHGPDVFNKRPRAQHVFKIRAFAHKIRLAHGSLGAYARHNGLAVNASGRRSFPPSIR